MSNSFNKKNAIKNYSKAIKYGLDIFQGRGIDYRDLQKLLRNEKKFLAFMDKKFDRDSLKDRDVIFFMSQALFGLINLKKMI